MALCRRLLGSRGCGNTLALRDVLVEARKAGAKGSFASPSDLQSKSHGRAFSSLLANWQNMRVSSNSRVQAGENFEACAAHHHLQVRHVYVEVIDNDLDAAIKVYKRKMNNAKIEDKLKEKRYYSKPSERRKLAKHYKKLNRARRELGAKVRTVKHRMEKIQEVRKLEKAEKRAKAAAAAAASAQKSESSR